MKANIGVIGGSGLYHMPGFEAHKEHVIDTPWGAPSDAYIVGSLAGKRSRSSRGIGAGIRYRRRTATPREHLRVQEVGVERILPLGAVGSLKDEHRPLDFVIPDQCRSTRGRVSTFFGEGLVAHISFAHPVCEQLAKTAFAPRRKEVGVNAARRQLLVGRRNGRFGRAWRNRICIEAGAWTSSA